MICLLDVLDAQLLNTTVRSCGVVMEGESEQ